MAQVPEKRQQSARRPEPPSTPLPASSGRNRVAAPMEAHLLAAKHRLEQYAVFRILESTAAGFTKDRVFSHAAAMTYYGIFSIFPLMLLAMSLAGWALQNAETAREQVLSVVTSLLPQGQEQLDNVIADVIKTKGTAAGIGTLTLLYSAYVWFQEVDANINEIWGVTKPRSWLKSLTLPMLMAASIGGVALSSFIATAAIHLLAQFTGGIPGSVVLWQTAVSLLSVLTIAGAFFLLYRYTPQRQVRFADVWPAALVMALLWEGTRRGLAVYIQKTNMISGYGLIGAAMALLVWIYSASLITLLGAELSYSLAKDRRHITPDQEMEVVAPPGEQPTPKFAPQVGAGFTTSTDETEPVSASRAHSPDDGGVGQRS